MHANVYFRRIVGRYKKSIPCISYVSQPLERKTLYSCCSPNVRRNKGLISFTSRYFPVCFYSNSPEVKQSSSENSTLPVIKPVQFENVSFDSTVSHEDLLLALHKCKNIPEQMEALVSTLSLTAEDVQKRNNFCKTLENLFRPFFNNFKIQMFGSTVNGFGFKGCDIDMTFETSTTKKEETHYLENPNVPFVNEVLSGEVSPQEISELPEKEQLLFLHTVMLEFYKESEDPTIFINAYVPLVRFYHDKYNLKCDLTFKNRVAYANTKLLFFFAKCDKRVIPLMMAIRYWAKHTELIVRGPAFNTYTMTLLLVYFLQTRNPPILPDAHSILSQSDKFDIDDMNDKSFLDILEKIPPSENKQHLGELLREFFFFYLYFDFTRVVCPLIAKSVPREEFFSATENRKFKMNTICVQDPLCKPHNVAELIEYKICKKFFTELLVICKIFQDNEVLTPAENHWGLMALLNKPPQYFLKNVVDQKTISVTLPLISRTMNKNISDHEKIRYSAETLLKILQDVLLIQCNILEYDEVAKLLISFDELFEKQKKVMEDLKEKRRLINIPRRHRKSSKALSEAENESNYADSPQEPLFEQFQRCNDNFKRVVLAKCSAYKNTWLGRDSVQLDNATSTSSSLLEKECYISNQVAKLNELNVSDKKIKPFEFIYECYISSKDPEIQLLINFRPLQKMSFNPILGIFLKEYIPKIVKNLNKNM